MRFTARSYGLRGCLEPAVKIRDAIPIYDAPSLEIDWTLHSLLYCITFRFEVRMRTLDVHDIHMNDTYKRDNSVDIIRSSAKTIVLCQYVYMRRNANTSPASYDLRCLGGFGMEGA